MTKFIKEPTKYFIEFKHGKKVVCEVSFSDGGNYGKPNFYISFHIEECKEVDNALKYVEVPESNFRYVDNTNNFCYKIPANLRLLCQALACGDLRGKSEMQTIHQLYYEWNFVNDLETKNK
jgi:hypothetical protein